MPYSPDSLDFNLWGTHRTEALNPYLEKEMDTATTAGCQCAAELGLPDEEVWGSNQQSLKQVCLAGLPATPGLRVGKRTALQQAGLLQRPAQNSNVELILLCAKPAPCGGLWRGQMSVELCTAPSCAERMVATEIAQALNLMRNTQLGSKQGVAASRVAHLAD